MTGPTTTDIRAALSDRELDSINGGKVTEIGIGKLTIQLNPDSGCWAIWWGKEFVGGACKK